MRVTVHALTQPLQRRFYPRLNARSKSALLLATFRNISDMAPSTLDSVIQSLASVSIIPAGAVCHDPSTYPASWRQVLDANTSSPKSFSLLKTLVYKPKTGKSAVPVPVVAIAPDDAEIASSALAKKFGLKELRLASEDLLTEFFSLDKDSREFSACDGPS
jgi:prolyl-tRNA synthetase